MLVGKNNVNITNPPFLLSISREKKEDENKILNVWLSLYYQRTV
jgi:hypothetical protein